VLDQIKALLKAGDSVCIERGRLSFITCDGRPINSEWIADNQEAVIIGICELAGALVYRYVGYSTGLYVGLNGGGVTLRLRELTKNDSAYVIFNAEGKFSRNTKHHKRGDKMPRGQFRANKESQFCQLWKSTGMELPQRLGTFHDRMGKLSNYFYTGETTKPERLNSRTFRPLSISEARFRELLNVPPDSRANTVQAPCNERTTTVQSHRTSKSLQPMPHKAMSAVQTTGTICYEKKLSREEDIKISSSDASHDEWLSQYDSVPVR
jgi:hypothetical protein